MGIKERKERHKEDLRLRILDAAKLLFLKDGYEATSIRKIAAAVEFSPTTIYLYYKDKTDIVYALQKEGFKLLRTQFSVLANVEDPFERLKAMGRTYMQFAIENNEFYELMFIMKEPLEYLDNEEGWDDGVEAFNFLVRTVADCQEKQYFLGQETKVFSLLVWSTLHGLCTLSLHGHLNHVVEKGMLEDNREGPFLEMVYESFIKFLAQLRA